MVTRATGACAKFPVEKIGQLTGRPSSGMRACTPDASVYPESGIVQHGVNVACRVCRKSCRTFSRIRLESDDLGLPFALLTIGIYFKFNRVFSVRNLDLAA